MKSSWILGISNSHNGAVSLIKDGKVKVAIQWERLSRKKKAPIFLSEDLQPLYECAQYCFETESIAPENISKIAITTPWKLTFLSSYYCNLLLGTKLTDSDIFYIPHHLSHAEYILHYGHGKKGIILVADGSGSFAADKDKMIPELVTQDSKMFVFPGGKETISCYFYNGKTTSLIYKFNSPYDSSPFLESIGHLWKFASQYCFNQKEQAGKVMGLVGYGKSTGVFAHLKENMALSVDYQSLLLTIPHKDDYGIENIGFETAANLAATVQESTNAVILDLLKKLLVDFPTRILYFSGGVALNILLNENLRRSGYFDQVIVNNASEDCGTAIGAALALNAYLYQQRSFTSLRDDYGKLYRDEDILRSLQNTKLNYLILPEEEVIKVVAKHLFDGKIVGWFQGRSEFGARALGKRSILANSMLRSNKDILDSSIKFREAFRPYALVVTEEMSSAYFGENIASPVMTHLGYIKTNQLPAVTHIDRSTRIQTVNCNGDLKLHKLLKAFGEISGFEVLLNTSFNRNKEPIVESPNDCIKVFKNTALDMLVLNNFIIYK